MAVNERKHIVLMAWPTSGLEVVGAGALMVLSFLTSLPGMAFLCLTFSPLFLSENHIAKYTSIGLCDIAHVYGG